MEIDSKQLPIDLFRVAFLLRLTHAHPSFLLVT
jgi:hypothetical protein